MSSSLPPWLAQAALLFPVATLVFLMYLVLSGTTITCSQRGIIALVFSLGAGLSGAFLGGAAAVSGKVSLPARLKDPFTFSATGGFAVLVVTMILTDQLFVKRCPEGADSYNFWAVVRDRTTNQAVPKADCQLKIDDRPVANHETDGVGRCPFEGQHHSALMQGNLTVVAVGYEPDSRWVSLTSHEPIEFSLAPAASSCRYQLAEGVLSLASTGGVGSLILETTGDCSWSATSLAPWLHVQPTASKGAGTISYSYTTNSDLERRVGILRIAGQDVRVDQAARKTVTGLACAPIPDGLIAWWRGESSGADVLQRHNGSVSSAVQFVDAIAGKGFHFRGRDAAIFTPDALDLRPNSITIETWVNFDALDAPATSQYGAAGIQFLAFKKNTRMFNFEGYSLRKQRVDDVDRFAFSVGDKNGQSVNALSTTRIETGTFYHVGGTYDGQRIRVFVNGIREDDIAGSITVDYDRRPLFLGTSGEQVFDGRLQGILDEVAIFERALNDDEIGAIYRAGPAGKCVPGAR